MTKYKGFAILEDSFDSCGAIQFEDDLEWLHNFIDCSTLDMPSRYIEGQRYVFIVDDCGLIKGRKPTAYRGFAQAANGHTDEFFAIDPMLFGTFIVTKTNGKGDFTDLSREDLKRLMKYTMTLDEGRAVLVNVGYR